MKKKMISGISIAALICTMAVPVNAQDKATILEAEIPSVFTLTIPADQAIAYNAEITGIGNISVTGNVKPGEHVTVAAVPQAFEDPVRKETFPFHILKKGTKEEFVSEVWSETELRDDSNPKEVELDVNIPGDTWASLKAGTYKGSIVFSAELGE